MRVVGRTAHAQKLPLSICLREILRLVFPPWQDVSSHQDPEALVFGREREVEKERDTSNMLYAAKGRNGRERVSLKLDPA